MFSKSIIHYNSVVNCKFLITLYTKFKYSIIVYEIKFNF